MSCIHLWLPNAGLFFCTERISLTLWEKNYLRDRSLIHYYPHIFLVWRIKILVEKDLDVTQLLHISIKTGMGHLNYIRVTRSTWMVAVVWVLGTTKVYDKLLTNCLHNTTNSPLSRAFYFSLLWLHLSPLSGSALYLYANSLAGKGHV